MRKNKVQVVLWINPELRLAAQARCQRESLSLSGFLRRCIEKFVAEGPWFLYIKRRP
jgi:hypothetical protein